MSEDLQPAEDVNDTVLGLHQQHRDDGELVPSNVFMSAPQPGTPLCRREYNRLL